MCRSFIALWLLAACGPAAPQADGGLLFLSEPLETVASQSGRLSLAVRTAPQPPSRGVVAILLTVSDPRGPVDGLAVTATPWMPDHGHGSAVRPAVTPQGSGVYLLTDVYLAMPGTWELRLDLKGAADDTATVSLQIP